MWVSRCVRAGGALGQLLLVVVLALGVFAMHGMGHPRESSHSTMSAAPRTAAMDMSTVSASRHDPTGVAVGGVTGGHGTEARNPSSSHGPSMAMDVLSLCVAVLLGVRVLTAPVRSALARRRERAARVLALVAAAARQEHPPRPPDLTRLSVLRL
ncbi:DUF6153 family protein [Streptomyces sp. NPDC002324]